ncbi:hypothetical protein ACFLVI_03210 [Chloroflexota bacterium]
METSNGAHERIPVEAVNFGTDVVCSVLTQRSYTNSHVPLFLDLMSP